MCEISPAIAWRKERVCDPHTPPNPRSSGGTGTIVIILITTTDMKTIEYIAPAIEVIEMEIQDVIAVSPGAIANPTINDDPTTHTGKNFWGD